MIGPLLREDYAAAIRDGVPYSKRESVSDPADVVEMDALCGYLTVVQGPYQGVLPGPVPLAKRDAAERARTAEQLDVAGTRTSDQRLLCVLPDDDQDECEQALRERLVTRRESVGADPAARSLLPLGAVTLATIASLAHGWQLGTRSAYLPEALLSAPQQ
ncbi:Imm49 family immunity protein [Streptomyces sp. A1136]|uniref:Imm49 family immunity protein n=1 Tax=Streptomyces sp. A1136 TaxID=2563102 RepID=UPI00109E4B86|nr:Imm49 family immunity protein [Streptomyces sp. A1136]THA47848.1 hypothetical protein E6R62_30405 [Streptomyces sp. A1136]